MTNNGPKSVWIAYSAGTRDVLPSRHVWERACIELAGVPLNEKQQAIVRQICSLRHDNAVRAANYLDIEVKQPGEFAEGWMPCHVTAEEIQLQVGWEPRS